MQTMHGKPMVLTVITAGCGDYRLYLYLCRKALFNLTVVHGVITELRNISSMQMNSSFFQFCISM
jgi:hypothetical protein